MTNKEAIILLREIKEKFTGNCTIDTLVPISRCDIQAIDLAIKALEEKLKGKWIYVCCYGDEFPQCSVCGEINDVKTKFCPDCGADMRGDTE